MNLVKFATLKDDLALMPDSDAAEDRLEMEKQRAHPQKSHLWVNTLI